MTPAACCGYTSSTRSRSWPTRRPTRPTKCTPSCSGRAEGAIADLGLPYRILDLCAGDLGISSARTFDIEVYAPGADRWLEVSSVSWFSDYQARRANIRFRPTGAKGTQLVHTLNGSGLAVPRVWAALVETYRRPDGSIEIPEVLHPYMGGTTVIPGPV